MAVPPRPTAQRDDEFLADSEAELGQRKAGFAGMSGHTPNHDKRPRLLVVDDDRNFLELAERLFIKEGYTPICTDAPQSALQIARTVKPAAIFLDILMPGFDGWDLLAALKADPVTADIPVFMISILSERAKALAAGADGIVMKPFDASKVKAALAGLMADDTARLRHRIMAPTLLLWGERDNFVPRADQDRLLAEIPRARLIVHAGAGHALHWEDPARAAREIAAFAALRG